MPGPTNPLMQRVRDSVAGTHDLLGELGTDEEGVLLYLARELATGVLVGVSVKQDNAEGTEFTVEVRRTLGETVAVQGSHCPECQTPLPDLERFCFQCGADLSGVTAADGTPESTRLLTALATATAGRFEILGRMDRERRAGTVYFARELNTQRIVALRLRRAEVSDAVQAEFVVRQTQVFRAMTPTPAVSGPAVAVADSHEIVAPMPRPAWLRTPALAGGAAVLLAIVAYFALSDSGSSASPPVGPVAGGATVAAAPAAPATSLPAPPSVPTPAPASATAVGAAAQAATPSTPASTDSGTLRIVAALPPDARITADGKTVRGRTMRLAAGSHLLIVTAPGFDPLTQRFIVRVGANIQWAPKLIATLVASTTTTPAPSADNRPRSPTTCKTTVKLEDWAKAIALCASEANAGDVSAAASLARIYSRGLGTRSDPAQALSWNTKAAQGGDRDAQTALGYALRDGVGTRRDAAGSVKWFKQAAEQGERAAQLEYAVALEKGDGVARDEKGAREWYRKAADQGNAMAARRLAKLFERGAGGAKSESDAAAAYERAASLGDADAALTIGKWYRDGRGVTRSTTQALVWFRKAAELGNDEARAEVRRLDKG